MENKGIGKVSIIVPAYNAEQYIRKCIDSLLSQTYENKEILVVDDGSKDSTRAVCEEYRKRHRTLIRTVYSEHGGVTNARLLGIRKAAGEYLAFVDTDDWVEEDYLSSMLLSMDGADIVAAGITREQLDEDGCAFCEYNGISPGVYDSETREKELYGKMLYCEKPYEFGVLPYLCNKIFRKDLLKPLMESLDTRIFDGEDAAAVYPYLLSAQKIVLTDECKYHYRNHENSVSLRDSEYAYLNASYLYQALYTCFQKSPYRKSLIGQLDNYMRRIIWKKDPAAYLDVNSFRFPYDKVKVGSKIILYGMGKMGTAFYQQLKQSHYYRLVAWADRNPKQFTDQTESVLRIFPQEIHAYVFDYIVIAIQNETTVEKIIEELLAMGVRGEKIIRQ